MPLTEEGTNGNANFRVALELIVDGIKPNVYVVYRNYARAGENEKDTMYIHYGSHLLQCPNRSDNFYSKTMTKLDESAPHFDAADMPKGEIPLYTCPVLSDSVLRINPYVGINYERYLLDGVKAVMHGTYHSSTLAVDSLGDVSSAVNLLLRCKAHTPPIPMFLEPCNKEAYNYETTGNILRMGADAISGMTSEFSYVKLLLGVCLGLSGTELSAYLEKEINGEFIY
jgi:L-asparaginase